MWLKLIAFVTLLEYIFIVPKILPARANDHGDFIGFVLCHSVIAFFAKIEIKDLSPQKRTTALWNGALGGALGYAWLLFQLRPMQRQIHHLLIANLMILGGILAGAWAERMKKGGRLRTSRGTRLGTTVRDGKLVPR